MPKYHKINLKIVGKAAYSASNFVENTKNAQI